MFEQAIATRVLGQYPISVATSLAFESACGIHPEIMVTKPPLLEFTQLWVNVRTLFRNFLGALDKDTVKGVSPPECAEAIAAEMTQISEIIREASADRCQVVFYLSDYTGMERKYPHAVLRMDNTVIQKEYTVLQKQSLEQLLKMLPPGEVKLFELKLQPPPGTPKAMILTHYAYDLLSHKEFAELVLLESHTGRIKRRAQWYTKYHNGKELTMFPFHEGLMQVFGDSETFRSGDSKLRKDLIEIATKYQWTALTSREKMMYGIDQMVNPYARVIMRNIMG